MKLIAGYIGKAGNMKIEKIPIVSHYPRPIREDEEEKKDDDNNR